MLPDRDYIYRASCVYVVDGDTYDFAVDLGFYMITTLRFRLRGIDTPELNSRDAFERDRAKQAKAVCERLLLADDAELVLRTHKADSFGRWLADVQVDGADLGAYLMNAGLAVPWVRR